jgi:hypothetical protein
MPSILLSIMPVKSLFSFTNSSKVSGNPLPLPLHYTAIMMPPAAWSKIPPTMPMSNTSTLSTIPRVTSLRRSLLALHVFDHRRMSPTSLPNLSPDRYLSVFAPCWGYYGHDPSVLCEEEMRRSCTHNFGYLSSVTPFLPCFTPHLLSQILSFIRFLTTRFYLHNHTDSHSTDVEEECWNVVTSSMMATSAY